MSKRIGFAGITLLALRCAGGCGGGDDGDGSNSSPKADLTPPDAGVSFPTPMFPGEPTPSPDASPVTCASTATPADPERVQFAPAFAGTYAAYELGPLPGIPPSRLGGTMLSPSDADVLLVAVNTETPNGAIAQVRVKRDACGHIVGYAGNAAILARTPYVDANLLLGPNGVVFYSEWPVNRVSEIPTASGWRPTYTVDLWTVGVGGGGPGGIGFVPPHLADPGGLRAVTWPNGYWYHLAYKTSGDTYAITASKQTATLANGPGGFAYVPKGSSGFPKQSIITCEWDIDKVVVYDANDQGDPVTASRAEFLTKFPRPWGAYFEPKTGDFIFLTWGGGAVDQLYVVQGFTPPPPPPSNPH